MLIWRVPALVAVWNSMGTKETSREEEKKTWISDWLGGCALAPTRRSCRHRRLFCRLRSQRSFLGRRLLRAFHRARFGRRLFNALRRTLLLGLGLFFGAADFEVAVIALLLSGVAAEFFVAAPLILADELFACLYIGKKELLAQNQVANLLYSWPRTVTCYGFESLRYFSCHPFYLFRLKLSPTV